MPVHAQRCHSNALPVHTLRQVFYVFIRVFTCFSVSGRPWESQKQTFSHILHILAPLGASGGLCVHVFSRMFNVLSAFGHCWEPLGASLRCSFSYVFLCVFSVSAASGSLWEPTRGARSTRVFTRFFAQRFTRASKGFNRPTQDAQPHPEGTPRTPPRSHRGPPREPHGPQGPTQGTHAYLQGPPGDSQGSHTGFQSPPKGSLREARAHASAFFSCIDMHGRARSTVSLKRASRSHA